MKKDNHIIRHQEAGIALIALLAIMLILGVVTYAFVSIISTHRYSSIAAYSSLKTRYITEGALQIGKKYVRDRWSTGTTVPLGANFTILTDEPLGDGTFSVWVSETDIGFATFTAYATVSY